MFPVTSSRSNRLLCDDNGLYFVIYISLLFISCAGEFELQGSGEPVHSVEIQSDGLLRDIEKMGYDSLIIQNSIGFPVLLQANDKFCCVYDVLLQRALCFDMSGYSTVFDPLGTEVGQIGSYFRGFGLSSDGVHCYIESEKGVYSYDLRKGLLTNVFSLEECFTFTRPRFGIFEIFRDSDSLLISQGSTPCFSEGLLSELSFDKDMLEKFRFLRVSSLDSEDSYYTYDMPMSELLQALRFSAEFQPWFAVDRSESTLYSVFNPTDDLYQVEITDQGFFRSILYDIELPYSELPKEYFFGADGVIPSDNSYLSYNFKIRSLEVNKGVVIILYNPSKTEALPLEDGPLFEHYILCLIDLVSQRMRCFKYDYKQLAYMGLVEDQLLFYDFGASENTNSLFSIIRRISYMTILGHGE